MKTQVEKADDKFRIALHPFVNPRIRAVAMPNGTFAYFLYAEDRRPKPETNVLRISARVYEFLSKTGAIKTVEDSLAGPSDAEREAIDSDRRARGKPAG